MAHRARRAAEVRGSGVADPAPLATALAALAVSNLATDRWVGGDAYVPWNLTMAAGLVALARRAGHTPDAMGLGRRRLPAGIGWGVAGAGVVGLAYALLLRRGGAGLLDDDRLRRLDARDARRYLLVRIPFGTALAEEVAFRAVLPAVLASASPAMRGWRRHLASSVLFGLWHILPSRRRAATSSRGGQAVLGRTVATSVLATTLAGAVLHALRERSGHLVGSVMVHAAANGIGFVAVRRAAR